MSITYPPYPSTFATNIKLSFNKSHDLYKKKNSNFQYSLTHAYSYSIRCIKGEKKLPLMINKQTNYLIKSSSPLYNDTIELEDIPFQFIFLRKRKLFDKLISYA